LELATPSEITLFSGTGASFLFWRASGEAAGVFFFEGMRFFGRAGATRSELLTSGYAESGK
jgi:hypothetical protein